MSGSRPSACQAPTTSMYLDPRGEVKACCQNVWQRLGNITETGLAELWHGRELDVLRGAVAAGDLTRGCERCAVHINQGRPEIAYARSFDWLEPSGDPPPWPRQLELALSNSCNLQCKMCNGELSSAIRIHREMRAPLPTVFGDPFFDELDLFLPHLRAVSILGGEPFLGVESLRVMQRLVDLGHRPLLTITTNGTQWSDRIARIVTAMPTHVTISIDGSTKETFERIRAGADHAEVMRNVDRFRAATTRSGGEVSVSFCMMRTNHHELGDLLHWADERAVSVYVNDVIHPPDLSLIHADATEAKEILSGLERQERGWSTPLGRNRMVWDEEIAKLRRMVTGNGPSPAATKVDPPKARQRSVGTGAPTIHTAMIEANRAQIITSVNAGSTQALGLDLKSLEGRSIWEVQRHVCEVLGDTASTKLDRSDDGTEWFQVTFVRANERITMSTFLRDQPTGGQRWAFEFATATHL